MSRVASDDFRSPRLWVQRPAEWQPSLAQQWGWPHFGADEWGRRVVTVGCRLFGYISWAYRTCWGCDDCHEVRAQTYRMLAGD